MLCGRSLLWFGRMAMIMGCWTFNKMIVANCWCAFSLHQGFTMSCGQLGRSHLHLHSAIGPSTMKIHKTLRSVPWVVIVGPLGWCSRSWSSWACRSLNMGISGDMKRRGKALLWREKGYRCNIDRGRTIGRHRDIVLANPKTHVDQSTSLWHTKINLEEMLSMYAYQRGQGIGDGM
jgi:hypothetical protein